MKNLKIKKKILLFIIIFIVIFVLLIIFNFIKQQNDKNYFIELNNQDLIGYFNSKDKNLLLYVGRDSCDTCKKMKFVLKNSLKNINKSIYYYNTETGKKDNEEDMKYLIKLLNVNIVPTIVYLVNGEVKDKMVGIKNEYEIEKFITTYYLEEKVNAL